MTKSQNPSSKQIPMAKVSNFKRKRLEALGNWSLELVWNLVLVMWCLWTAGAATATIVGGGGRASTDCLAVFDATVNVPAPPRAPHHIRCVDGDSSCDADGLANGVCVFPVNICANSTFDSSRCTLAGVDFLTIDHAVDDGQDPKFDPEFLAMQDRVDSGIHPPNSTPNVCTTLANDFHVPVKGPFKKKGKNTCRPNRKTLRMTATALVMGVGYSDRDTLKMTCVPSTCDPAVFFTGTFDRIQRQIFDQSCAKGTCHDSQSMAGGMLLETGASYGQTVNVTPTNPVAQDPPYSWLRIKTSSPTSGDPDASYLYHKITGDLPDPGLLARMPRNRRKLNATLIEVIRLWIENGAPQTHWVPGTD
jgi:hypothetical protein